MHMESETEETYRLRNIADTTVEQLSMSSPPSLTNVSGTSTPNPGGSSEQGRGKNETVPRALTERMDTSLRNSSSSSPGKRPTPVVEALRLHGAKKPALHISPGVSVLSNEANGSGLLWRAQSPSDPPAINPFKKLPLELLALIFQLGTRDNPATFPTLVAQVTRYWRETALSRKSLWTYINWSGADPEVKASRWLERSASIDNPMHSAPIYISLAIEEGFEPDVAQIQYVINFLKPEIHRWGSFRIHVDREPLEAALELCDTAAPLLHSLSIGCSDSEGIEDQFVLFDDLTPSLRTLRLFKVPVVWTGPLLNNLTELHLVDLEDGFGPSVEELISILEASPRLKSLGLDNAGICVRSASDFNPKMLHMSHLEHIQMTRLDRDMYVWFARYMKAPRVHTYVCSEFEETVAEIDMSANCPVPNLQKLVAIHAQINTPLVRDLLKLVKASEMQCYYCSVEDGVLEELVWGPGKRRCPNLTKLKLFRCNGFSVEVLKRVVSSRQPNGNESATLPLMRPPAVLRTTEILGSTVPVSAADLQWFQDHNVAWIDEVRAEHRTVEQVFEGLTV
ncbi:hypothetical protein FRB93_007061 [Tulasnella sp. JGI-2019a]|nr:hypothetical protein FRB93_007061 [Tulasnella sp. JGI-2019a]